MILEEVNNAGVWAKANVKDTAKLLAKVYGLDESIMQAVQERAGDRRIVPVDDQVLTALQTMADTFTQLKVIPKKIDVKDSNYNWVFPQQWS